MGYGAQATRVPAKGAANLVDADVYKLGIMGRFVRGIEGIHKENFSMSDIDKVCGGFNSSYLSPYVLQSFYDELDSSLSVETKVLPYISDSASQATAEIMDEASTPVKIFDINAGYKGNTDKSLFGNRIAQKITQSENFTMRLITDTGATPTTVVLDSVDHLEIGYYVKFTDGANTEYAVIASIDRSIKTITFASLSNTYTAALTTISRIDWNLYVAIKDDYGIYDMREEWLDMPFAKSDVIGMASAVNDPVTGSEYIVLAVNSSNSSTPDTQRPVAVDTWTPLTGGSDGGSADEAVYRTLVEDFADEDMMILLAPELSSTVHNANMAEYTTDGYKCMYNGQGAYEAGEDLLKNLGALLRKPFTFAQIPSDKWIEVDDPAKNSGKISIPMTGICAATWFNTYAKEGESKVAAGNKNEMVLKTNGRLIDSNGLVHNDREGRGGRLIRDYSINITRYRKGKGITINSARTLSTDDGYKFQNQIMQWLLYKKSILAYLQLIEQDRAGVRAQESHRNAVWAYMFKKWEGGHLYQGQKEDGSKTEFGDACVIVNDFTVNTLADINDGKETTFLQFIAPPPIEEPRLNLASAGITTVRA